MRDTLDFKLELRPRLQWQTTPSQASSHPIKGGVQDIKKAPQTECRGPLGPQKVPTSPHRLVGTAGQ